MIGQNSDKCGPKNPGQCPPIYFYRNDDDVHFPLIQYYLQEANHSNYLQIQLTLSISNSQGCSKYREFEIERGK